MRESEDMKFFGEISEFEVSGNSLVVRIPHYHRSASGLLSQTHVFTVPRISENAEGKHIKEIILTPYLPNSWANLYRVEYKARDKPGVNSVLTKILANLSINIYTQESLTTDRELIHTISLIVDISAFDEKDKTDDEDRITYLSKRIKSHLDQQNVDLDLERIEEIQFLHDNYYPSENCPNLIQKEYLRHYFWSALRSNPIAKKSVEIKDDVLKHLDLVGDGFKTIRSLKGTIVSDTEDKYILIRFFRLDQYVIYLDVVHRNVIGLISQFTEIISQNEENYNILSCYSRIEDVKNNAHWYVMLDVSSKPASVLNMLRELKKKIHEIVEIRVLDYTDNLSQDGINLPESEKMKARRLKEEEEKRKLKRNENNLLTKLSIKEQREKEFEQITMANTRYLLLNAVFVFILVLYLMFDDISSFGRIIFRIATITSGLVAFTASLITIVSFYRRQKR